VVGISVAAATTIGVSVGVETPETPVAIAVAVGAAAMTDGMPLAIAVGVTLELSGGTGTEDTAVGMAPSVAVTVPGSSIVGATVGILMGNAAGMMGAGVSDATTVPVPETSIVGSGSAVETLGITLGAAAVIVGRAGIRVATTVGADATLLPIVVATPPGNAVTLATADELLPAAGVATSFAKGGRMTARAAFVGLTVGAGRIGVGDGAATPLVDRPVLPDAMGTAGMERDAGRAGRPLFARTITGLIARGVADMSARTVARAVECASTRVVSCGVGHTVAVATYATDVRTPNTGVLVGEGPAGTDVAVSASATGVDVTVGTKDGAAVAVPAAPPTTPPLPLTAGVTTAGAVIAGVVMAPGMIVIVVTVGAAVGPPPKRVADVIIPAAPAPEVTMAEARASFACAVARPVAPDRPPNAEMAVGVPIVAPAVPTAPGPLPPMLPRATRPIVGVTVKRCNAGNCDAAAARVAAKEGVRVA